MIAGVGDFLRRPLCAHWPDLLPISAPSLGSRASNHSLFNFSVPVPLN